MEAGEITADTAESLIRGEAADFAAALEAFGLRMQPSDAMEFVDQVEGELSKLEPYEPPVGHTFTPGLYARTCSPQRGALFTSKIHKKEHQFVLHTGVISIWTREQGMVTLQAPAHGITTAGTRRIVFAHTDTVFTTFHPTELTDLSAIEDELIMKHDNPLLKSQEVLP